MTELQTSAWTQSSSSKPRGQGGRKQSPGPVSCPSTADQAKKHRGGAPVPAAGGVPEKAPPDVLDTGGGSLSLALDTFPNGTGSERTQQGLELAKSFRDGSIKLPDLLSGEGFHVFKSDTRDTGRSKEMKEMKKKTSRSSRSRRKHFNRRRICIIGLVAHGIVIIILVVVFVMINGGWPVWSQACSSNEACPAAAPICQTGGSCGKSRVVEPISAMPSDIRERAEQWIEDTEEEVASISDRGFKGSQHGWTKWVRSVIPIIGQNVTSDAALFEAAYLLENLLYPGGTEVDMGSQKFIDVMREEKDAFFFVAGACPASWMEWATTRFRPGRPRETKQIDTYGVFVNEEAVLSYPPCEGDVESCDEAAPFRRCSDCRDSHDECKDRDKRMADSVGKFLLEYGKDHEIMLPQRPGATESLTNVTEDIMGQSDPPDWWSWRALSDYAMDAELEESSRRYAEEVHGFQWKRTDEPDQCWDDVDWYDGSPTGEEERCDKYVEEDWCTESGEKGPGWQNATGRSGKDFADYAGANGRDATQACCGCGGGSSDRPARFLYKLKSERCPDKDVTETCDDALEREIKVPTDSWELPATANVIA